MSDGCDKPVECQRDSTVWRDLCDWVRENCGFVHPHLMLRSNSTDESADHASHRGVFVTRFVPRGSLLIRIPSSIALGGQNVANFPPPNDTNTIRPASSWLRCLASFYKARSDKFWTPYMNSLPHQYETLLRWPSEEINQLLAGTTLADEYVRDGARVVLMDRYQQQVRPFLERLGILSPVEQHREVEQSEMEQFLLACQAISTRCFHLGDGGSVAVATSLCPSHNTLSTDTESRRLPTFAGPYFFPVMDLLNHTSNSNALGTVLQMHPSHRTDSAVGTAASSDQFAYQMVAERDLEAGEELLHSYGTDLTAAQFLQSFGFVDRFVMRRACGGGANPVAASACVRSPYSPAIWTKDYIWESCWSTMQSPETLKRVAQLMQNNDDETWELQVDRSRGEWLPSSVVLSGCDPWSDELVTLLAVPFLPTEAYQELANSPSSCLDSSILDDAYLGTLVCLTVLSLIRDHQRRYPVLTHKSCECEDDATLLQALLESDPASTDVSTTRLMYALAIRLEEKRCLQTLRQGALELLSSLANDPAEAETMGLLNEPTTKRPRPHVPQSS